MAITELETGHQGLTEVFCLMAQITFETPSLSRPVPQKAKQNNAAAIGSVQRSGSLVGDEFGEGCGGA